jgi:hypothetical protein
MLIFPAFPQTSSLVEAFLEDAFTTAWPHLPNAVAEVRASPDAQASAAALTRIHDTLIQPAPLSADRFAALSRDAHGCLVGRTPLRGEPLGLLVLIYAIASGLHAFDLSAAAARRGVDARTRTWLQGESRLWASEASAFSAQSAARLNAVAAASPEAETVSPALWHNAVAARLKTLEEFVHVRGAA